MELIRGKIRNREYASKLRDFSGMKFGNITPTDIDGFFEIKDKIYCFFETKYGSSELPTGQRIALERLVDLVGENKEAILVVGEHNCTDGIDIDLAKCSVRQYRYKKTWHIPNEETTIRELTNRFLKKVGYDI